MPYTYLYVRASYLYVSASYLYFRAWYLYVRGVYVPCTDAPRAHPFRRAPRNTVITHKHNSKLSAPVCVQYKMVSGQTFQNVWLFRMFDFSECLPCPDRRCQECRMAPACVGRGGGTWCKSGTEKQRGRATERQRDRGTQRHRDTERLREAGRR